MSFWSKLFGRPGESRAAERSSPQDAFAAEVQAVLRSIPEVTQLHYDREAFSIKLELDGSEPILFLGNLFAETREIGSSARAERIRTLLDSIRSGSDASNDDWDEAKHRVVPLLRVSTNFILMPIPTEQAPYRRRFVPFLIECVGLDANASTAFVGPKLSAPWNVTAAALHEQARGNLAAHVAAEEDVSILDKDAPYPLWVVSRNDSYEASRLLLPGWLASFAARVHGRPVAIVPERLTVIIGGDGDEACLRRLIDTAMREYRTAPRSISPALYSVDADGKVVPLELPPGHALAKEVGLGHITLAANEYAAQKEALDKQLQEDVYVAAFAVVQDADATYSSYTTWARDTPSLLPEAAEIVFVDENDPNDRQMFAVPWTLAREAVGACLVLEPDLDPPRWRSVRWPDAAIVSELRLGRELPRKAKS